MRYQAFPFAPLALSSLIVVALASCRAPEEPPTPIPQGTPRLVLFIVIDQLRADYLERFRPLFTGGLDRLLRESAVFTDAHQHHNVTSTAPGHATLSTGSFPSSHGIIGNEWYDRERRETIYVLDDDTYGASPARLLRATLGDRLKETWPNAKVFAVGGKDRSAALTAGRRADAAYWYDRQSGGVTTSPYYRDAPSADRASWLKDFLSQNFLDSFFGTAWRPLVSDEQMAAFGVETLDRGLFRRGFPHALGGPSAYPDRSFYSAIYATPFVDAFIVELAKALIDGEQLGADEVPDFLGVTLSALDAVGHSNGPDAPETLDTLLRVDRILGDLLDFVDERIGLDQVVVSLSADHGVGQVPEIRVARGLDGGRISADGILCMQRASRSVGQRFSLDDLDWMPSLLYLDRDTLSTAGADYEQVRTALAESLSACPRVERVFRPEDIVRELDPPLDELYFNGYFPERSGDLMILLEENTLFGSTIASHGQAYRYDTHVPWLLRSPQGHNVVLDRSVRTVDVAPTVAHFLGIDLPDADGDDLSAMLRSLQK